MYVYNTGPSSWRHHWALRAWVQRAFSTNWSCSREEVPCLAWKKKNSWPFKKLENYDDQMIKSWSNHQLSKIGGLSDKPWQTHVQCSGDWQIVCQDRSEFQTTAVPALSPRFCQIVRTCHDQTRSTTTITFSYQLQLLYHLSKSSLLGESFTFNAVTFLPSRRGSQSRAMRADQDMWTEADLIRKTWHGYAWVLSWMQACATAALHFATYDIFSSLRNAALDTA
jgi:hypothetical protein